VKLDCAVTKGAPARIDGRSVARVNHEIYFFSTPSSLRSFRRDPLKWCGQVTDPVTLMRFRPGKRSPRTDWNDRPYFFASDSTLAVFRGAPETYAERPAGMLPKPEGEGSPPEEKAAGAAESGSPPAVR
jgi:YHS domain-containing protein